MSLAKAQPAKRVYELHACLKQVKRSAGRSSVAAASYRSGSRLQDERTGILHDYTRKQGVEHTQIFVPDGAPDWAHDRERLWNEVELKENRSNSTMAHELVIGFPAEFDFAQRREAGERICQELVERYGCAVDIAYHQPHRKGDERNFHAHLMFTTRGFDPGTADGWSRTKFRHLSADKSTEEGDQTSRGSREVKSLRAYTAGVMNFIAERDGLDVVTEYLSFEERGIDQTPTQHIGPHANKLEQGNVASDRGNVNRAIRAANENGRRIEQARNVITLESRRLEREITKLERAEITLLLAQKHKHYAVQKEQVGRAKEDVQTAQDRLQNLTWAQKVMGLQKTCEADLSAKEQTLEQARQRLDELARSWAVTHFLRGRSKDEDLHVAAGALRAQKLEDYERLKEAYARDQEERQSLQDEQRALDGEERTLALITGRADQIEERLTQLNRQIDAFESSRGFQAEQRFLKIREQQEQRIAALENEKDFLSQRQDLAGQEASMSDDVADSWLYAGSEDSTEAGSGKDRSPVRTPAELESLKEQARANIREQMDQESSKERGGRGQDES